MAKVKFIGPSGQVSYLVGIETGSPELEPGKTYDLPNDLAKKLRTSSKMWETAKETKKTED